MPDDNRFYREFIPTPVGRFPGTVDEPCRHPLDLRSSFMERGKRWQRCCICGATRFGCGPWDRERSLRDVEKER